MYIEYFHSFQRRVRKRDNRKKYLNVLLILIFKQILYYKNHVI